MLFGEVFKLLADINTSTQAAQPSANDVEANIVMSHLTKSCMDCGPVNETSNESCKDCHSARFADSPNKAKGAAAVSQAVGGEVAMMLLPAAAEAKKECVLECTFLSGVADAAMETLLRAGSIVPIFGEVCMCV